MKKLLPIIFLANDLWAQTNAANCGARGTCISRPAGALQNIAKVEETTTSIDWMVRTVPMLAGIFFLVAAGKKISEKDWESGFARLGGALVSFISLAISNYYFG